MTKISIVASGSRGDVQPYIAVGQGLKKAGYDVRVLTNDNFESLVTSADLAFSSTGESVEAVLQSEAWRKTIDSGNFLKILARMQTEMKQRATENAQRMPALLEGSDLILTGMGGFGGVFSIAEALKIPVIQAYVFPFTPTQAFPAPLVPNLPVGGLLNRLSFHLMRQIFWQSSKAGDVATRKALGLRPGSFWGPFHALNRQLGPVLYGYSPRVLPRPHDWPANQQVTGYWYLDSTHSWTPPADLVEFLQAGQPPVYIGFGSMGSRNPEEAGNIALEALARTGQRGILASGWGGLKATDLPAHVHMISGAPHDWLFPRMAAVVHHGGAGTTAAGVGAGVPTITVPFMGDQPFWGQRIAALGVGPTPIPRKQLTANRLAQAIHTAVEDVRMRQRASTLGEKIRAEDGVAQATLALDRFIQQHRP